MPQNADAPHGREAAARSTAENVFETAVATYFAERRTRVDAFVDRHFTFRGSLALHRHALGWGLVRVPVNLVLTAPIATLKAATVVVRGLGANTLAHWLGTRDLFLRMAIARRIEDLVQTELLGTPNDLCGCSSTGDALYQAMLADPRVPFPMRKAMPLASEGRAWNGGLPEILATYHGIRTAAGEMSSACVSFGVGALDFGKVTPGMMTLCPNVTAVLAHQTAVASFPFSATLGGLWYAMFPAVVLTGLLIGTLVVLILLSASLAAVVGVVADPLQRRFGVHQRRLHRLLDVLEANLRGPTRESLAVKDHCVARLLELLDYAAPVSRILRAG